MKTFLIAFALGVFTGAAVTAYFTSPETYERMKADKARLLEETPALAETGEAPIPQPELPEPEPEAPAPSAQPAPPTEMPRTDAATSPPPSAQPSVETPEPAQAEPPKPASQTVPKTAPEPAPETEPEPPAKSTPPAAQLNPIDSKIATAIRAQFKLDDAIRDLAIEIDVKDRVVTLNGKVPDSELALHIIETAAATKGVLEVESKNLTVAP